MPIRSFDAIVIGAGQAGPAIAARCSKEGLKTAVIERHHFGGTCHAALQHVKAAAEQIKTTDRWAVLLRYVSDRIAPVIGPFRLPQAPPGTG